MIKPDWKRTSALPPDDLARLLEEDHDEVDDNPPATDADLAAMRLMKRKPGQRGPGKRPALVSVTLRLEQDTVAAYKASGAGWQGRMRKALREAAKAGSK